MKCFNKPKFQISTTKTWKVEIDPTSSGVDNLRQQENKTGLKDNISIAM